jgi:hypothetical protein
MHPEHRSKLGFLLFMFSVVRIVALVLRIAWASNSTNISLAIAANVFTAAGVVIIFIVNLIVTRRVLGDYARFGGHRALDLGLRFLLFSIVACLIMVITSTVYSFFTLDAHTRQQCRDIQLVASTYLTFLAFIPVPAVVLAWLFRGPAVGDTRAKRRFNAKAQLLLVTSVLLTLGAGFRCGTTFDARPLGQVMWFHHKAAYYCFNFGIEIIVLYIFVLARFDSRFRLPQRLHDDNAGNVDTDTEGKVLARRGGFFGRLNHDREIFGGGDAARDGREQ